MAEPARRLLTVALFGLLGAGFLGSGLVGGVGPAYADGSLAVSPATGADDTPMQVTTPGGCPSPATNVLVKIFGPGFGKDGENVVGNTPLDDPDRPVTLPLSQTLRATAAAHAPPVTLHGVYTVVVTCRLPLNRASYTDYAGSIEFTGPHSYRRTARRAVMAAEPRATPDPPGTVRHTAPAVAPPSIVDEKPAAGGGWHLDWPLIVVAGLGLGLLVVFGVQPAWARRRAAAAARGRPANRPAEAPPAAAPASQPATSPAKQPAAKGPTAKATARAPATRGGAGKAPATRASRNGNQTSIAAQAAQAAADRAAEAKAAAATAVAQATAAEAEAAAAAAEAAVAEQAAASARAAKRAGTPKAGAKRR
ncbi:MAG: hypothetical protein V7637_1257 [Mycobacteriales bacterium]